MLLKLPISLSNQIKKLTQNIIGISWYMYFFLSSKSNFSDVIYTQTLKKYVIISEKIALAMLFSVFWVNQECISRKKSIHVSRITTRVIGNLDTMFFIDSLKLSILKDLNIFLIIIILNNKFKLNLNITVYNKNSSIF